MNDWCTLKLSEACHKVTDGTHDSPVSIINDGYPLIKGKDISKGFIDFVNCEIISYSDHLTIIKRSKPEKGDVLFSNIGNSIGDCVYVDTDKEFSIKNVALFKPNAKIIYPKYLYYLVKSKQFQGEIENKISGSAQPFASLNLLRNNKIKFPKKLKDQEMIADNLFKYDTIIKNNNKKIRLIENLIQYTFEEWFFRYKINYKKLKIDKKTNLPSGWEIIDLSSIVDFIGGYAFKSKNYEENKKYKIVTIKNVQDGFFNNDIKDTISKLPKNINDQQILQPGDIIMSLTGNIGRVCIVHGKNNLLNQRVVKLKSKKKIDYSYIYSLFRNKSMQTQLENISNGTAQQNLSPVNASKIKIHVPYEVTRKEYNKIIKKYINLIINLNLQNECLKNIQELTLTQSITGFLKVKI